MISNPEHPDVSGTIAIAHNAAPRSAICISCGLEYRLPVGPMIVDQETGERFCVYCANAVNPHVGAQFQAAERWYRHYLETSHLLTLGHALDLYPKGLWTRGSGSSTSYSTDELIMRSTYAEPADQEFDLEQPVLFIDGAIYPAVPQVEHDVQPLFRLSSKEGRRGNLDEQLVESSDLWLDLARVCWTPHDLRTRLTLDQRAIQADNEGYWRFYQNEDSCHVIATDMTTMLFLLVRDLEHAEEAAITLALSRIETPEVIAARARNDDETAWVLKDAAIEEVVAALHQVDRANRAEVERVVGAPIRVRMAGSADTPFWPLQRD